MMDKGFSQVELAERIRVDEMTIVNWEKGKTRPVPKYHERLEGFLRGIAQWPEE